MASKIDFDAEQWRLLVEAPSAAAMGIVVADFGVVSFAKEALVMVKFAHRAKERYTGNALIQDVLAELTAGGQGARVLDDHSERSVAESEQYLLDKVRTAAALVDERIGGGAEGREYKQLVYDYADEVAHAAGEGWLGLGDKVSAKEAVFLEQLRVALGLA